MKAYEPMSFVCFHVLSCLLPKQTLPQLNLGSNDIGGYVGEESQDQAIYTPGGPKAIADALRASGSLTSVNVLCNHLDVESAGMLLEVKAEKPSLRTLCGLTYEETQLDVSHEGLGPGDAMLLAPELSAVASLTSVRTPAHETMP